MPKGIILRRDQLKKTKHRPCVLRLANLDQPSYRTKSFGHLGFCYAVCENLLGIRREPFSEHVTQYFPLFRSSPGLRNRAPDWMKTSPRLEAIPTSFLSVLLLSTSMPVHLPTIFQDYKVRDIVPNRLPVLGRQRGMNAYIVPRQPIRSTCFTNSNSALL